MSYRLLLMYFLASLFLFSFSLPGLGLTLFIDFNNAESEIQAFKIKRVGGLENIVVLPSYERISLRQRAEARRANTKLDQLISQAQECAINEGKKQSFCIDVYPQIRKAELARIKATGNYSFADLKAELSQLSERNPELRFDMLVVSGHHELGFYRGELTQATDREFAEVIAHGQVMFARLNTVVLLGCGTGTRGGYQNYISPLFPNVTLIVGAEDNAPTRDEPRNLAFIRKLNGSRTNLLNGKTKKEIEPLVQSLRAENWPVSLLWRNETLFLKDATQRF
jgi:hypothetical protein